MVANFKQKRFDILNSDYGTGDYQHIINKVMYNFKCLFLLAYPHCIHFNIRDFKPCYVFVPKQKFRLYTTFQTPFYSILMSSLFIVFFIKFFVFYTGMTQVYLFSDLCRVMMEQLFKKFQMYDFLPVLIVMYITKFKLSIANLIQVFFYLHC